MTDTARRHATDRDPRSPDAIRRRRGPDLRLAPSAALAWLAVAVTIHLRSILPVLVFACVAVLLWGITRQLRRGTWAQWHQATIGWLYSGLASAVVAAIAAGAVALRITRVDQHPLIKQAADGGGSFRGEVSVTGGMRQLAGGVAKVPVNVPGLGDVALFMNPDHLTPQVMNAQPGTGLALAARVRTSDQADLIPITLSSSRSAELAHEPQGIAGASAQVRSTIRELARGLTETTAGTRWGSWLGDAPSLIPGMVLGDTSLMSPEVRQTFLATGLSHLTAVSGLHVAIVASSVMVATTAVGLARRTRLVCVMGVNSAVRTGGGLRTEHHSGNHHGAGGSSGRREFPVERFAFRPGGGCVVGVVVRAGHGGALQPGVIRGCHDCHHRGLPVAWPAVDSCLAAGDPSSVEP